MRDPDLSVFQEAILARAANSRAKSAELDVSLVELVEASRRLREVGEPLRGERYRSPSAERGGKLSFSRGVGVRSNLGDAA